MNTNNKPIFILGVGAQKGGTSWLYNYIKKNPHANMGYRKEYHIWDAKFKPDYFRSFIANPKEDEGEGHKLRRKMQTIDGAYEEYFKSLIEKDIYITGDITPSYSGLDAEHYSIIKERIEAAGFSIRVIFLMRDPVARCWSAARMRFRKRKKKGANITEKRIIKRFPSIFRSKGS